MATIEAGLDPYPASAGRLRYRGWRMVAIGFVIFFFAFGGPVSGIPMLYAEVMREFGWNRTQATLIYTFSSAGGAFVALFVLGRLVERFGLRTALLTCLAMQGIGLVFFLAVHSLTTYYIAGLLTGLGQGTTLICVSVLVTRWFTRNVGLAGGIAMMGSSFGGIVFPQIINLLLPAIGWRFTFAGLSLGMFLVAMPLALLARYQPSEAEALHDTMPPNAAIAPERLRAAELDLSFGDLVRMPMFWFIAAAMVLTSAVDQGVFQHTMLFLTKEVHLSSTIAATAISVTFAVGFCAKLLAGRVFDWLSVKGVMIWYVVLAIAVLLAFPVQGVLTAMIFATARGIAHGGLVSETPVLAKHCFGPRLLHRVLPIYAGCFSIGSAIGPVSLAMIYDRTGSYKAGFILFAAIALVAGLLLIAARPLYRERLRALAGA